MNIYITKIKSNYRDNRSKISIHKLESRIRSKISKHKLELTNRIRDLRAFLNLLTTKSFFSTRQFVSMAVRSVIKTKPIRNLINQTGLKKLRYGITHLAKSERGDVPGWVLVVLMTTGLVTGIWTVAQPRLSSILKNSLDNMNSIR